MSRESTPPPTSNSRYPISSPSSKEDHAPARRSNPQQRVRKSVSYNPAQSPHMQYFLRHPCLGNLQRTGSAEDLRSGTKLKGGLAGPVGFARLPCTPVPSPLSSI